MEPVMQISFTFVRLNKSMIREMLLQISSEMRQSDPAFTKYIPEYIL